jgi:hypothetical protein
MSLIATAAPWNAGETTKRVSTLRKTIKKTTGLPDILPDYNSRNANDLQGSQYEDMGRGAPASSSETSEKSVFGVYAPDTKRSEKVLELMNNLNTDNDGSHLANYNPPPSNSVFKERPVQPVPKASDPIPHPQNEFQLLPPSEQFKASSENRFYPSSSSFSDINFSKYRDTYLNRGQNQYLDSASSASPYRDAVSTKLMDKINYMIHMLEQQQNERTDHLMEEFILYTLLGVFIIFIVDAFARSGNGKYVR